MAKELTQPTDEQIRTRAYYLWESEGRPQGRDWDYWLRAKTELAPGGKPASAAVIAPRKAAAIESPKRRASRTAMLA